MAAVAVDEKMADRDYNWRHRKIIESWVGAPWRRAIEQLELSARDLDKENCDENEYLAILARIDELALRKILEEVCA